MITNLPSGKRVMVLVTVVPGDWYLGEMGGMWKHHSDAGELFEEKNCEVCGHPIDTDGFTGEHFGDEDVAHVECVKTVDAYELFAAYKEQCDDDQGQ
ncbi:MAG: hypothetical protein ACW99G_11630 [Candidatus Thorarchaeota archaeon]|jgi:hypothetical protein